MDLFHTHISESSIERVTQALRSTFVSEGKLVREFEATLSAQLELIRPAAVNSGTSALHLALDLAGVGPGDEVILPAQTFIATGLVILQQRATPVFADIDPMTGNLNPESLLHKITPRTRAVMPVHWAGYPCDLDEINAIARENRIVVIEDAAHALGATYRGKPIGAISRLTAFSFQAIKQLTTGDGGALCCLDERDSRLAFTRRWFGIDRANDKPDVLGERVYNIDHVGYKYHMNDLAAAVGLGNLHDFPHRLARRRAIAARYRQELEDTPGLTLLREDSDRESAYWVFTVRVEGRVDFIRKLAGHGIPASVVHLRIDRHSVFGGTREDLPGQAAFNADQVAIPVHEGLSDDEVEQVITHVRKGW
ncbi:MAG TPA: DegT/DnrJ/EryC1/StrS family aminotransferase [Gemmataceae bacterium]|jgi:perosamine synthetase